MTIGCVCSVVAAKSKLTTGVFSFFLRLGGRGKMTIGCLVLASVVVADKGGSSTRAREPVGVSKGGRRPATRHANRPASFVVGVGRWRPPSRARIVVRKRRRQWFGRNLRQNPGTG